VGLVLAWFWLGFGLVWLGLATEQGVIILEYQRYYYYSCGGFHPIDFEKRIVSDGISFFPLGTISHGPLFSCLGLARYELLPLRV